MSKVYFSSARTLRWNYENSVPGKLEALLEQLSLADRLGSDDWVAIKTHLRQPFSGHNSSLTVSGEP